jgi:glycosyltransferase involved in cell wall biosynthesis
LKAAIAREPTGARRLSPPTPRRVLLVTPWYPTTADPIAGSFCRDNLAALQQAGHDARVLHVSPDASERSTETVRRARYPATRRASLPLAPARAVAALAAALRERRPDLIHAHVTLPVGLTAALVGRAAGLPVVLTEHTGPFESLIAGSPLRRRLAAWTLANVAAVVPVSQALARQMRPHLAPSVPLEVVPNPVDVAAFAAALGPRPGRDRLIFVGRLAPEKRLADLLAALRSLRLDRPNATLRLVGEGPERPALARAAGDLGLGAAVSFAGRLDRAGVAAELAAADLLVLPSEAETFGCVLVEALAAGRPAVATRCGGPEEIVVPAVGALAPVGDPPALAAALAETLERAFDPATLSAHAAAWSFPTVAARLATIYDRALRADR